MDMADDELRTFVCKECGHEVVVRPTLPKDYEPNICTPYYNQVVRPRMDALDRKIVKELHKLFGLLGLQFPGEM